MGIRPPGVKVREKVVLRILARTLLPSRVLNFGKKGTVSTLHLGMAVFQLALMIALK